MSCPDFIDPDDWTILLEQARKFQGFTLHAVLDCDEVYLVTWDFSLWRWDPVDGCFMPTERLEDR